MSWEASNIGAEESLIGALILGGANERVFEMVKPSDIYSKSISSFYSAILETHKRGNNVDLITVAENLSDSDFSALGILAKNTPSAANIYAYARIVVDKSSERKAITLSLEAVELIKGEGTAQDKTAAALALVSQIQAPDDEEGLIHVKDIGGQWLDAYEERISDDGIKGLKTGITGLDELYGHRGVGETDLVVIGGRSKMGKTALATMISGEVAYSGNHTAVFSMEMPRFQLFERFLTQDAQISGDKFYQEMDEYEFARISQTIGKMSGSNLYFDDRSSLSLNQIKSACRKHKETHGSLGAVFVDYFTLMKIESAARHDLAHGANSTGLKNMAKELKCPVFLLAQLSRGVDSRPNKRPLISDLRESGSLEQDADSIIFLYKDSVYNPDNGLGGLTEVILAANRHGAAGTAFVDMKAGFFVNMDESGVNDRNFSAGNDKQDDWNN